MNKLNKLLNSNFTKYLGCSLIATVVDVGIVWILLKMHVDIVIANTAGVVISFFVSYVLSLKKAFDIKHSTRAFSVFFYTFLLGLILSDIIIKTSYNMTIKYGENTAFIISKTLALVIPFFVMYIIRRKFLLNKK